MPALAIIGGTGLSALPGLTSSGEVRLDTPYGRPSAPIKLGSLQGTEIAFLGRHGEQHTIAPHRINYRANLEALRQMGVRRVLAVAAVGGIAAECRPQRLVIPDQIIDYTYGRAHTFYEEEADGVTHIDFSEPYSPQLRARLLQAAREAQLDALDGGVYGATQGPRLETPAEIERMARDGCTIVGMTGMPEAALAREAGLEYACCAVVANWAAGCGDAAAISMADIEANLALGMAGVRAVLQRFLAAD